jgi:hypothetical protein
LPISLKIKRDVKNEFEKCDVWSDTNFLVVMFLLETLLNVQTQKVLPIFLSLVLYLKAKVAGMMMKSMEA